MSYRLLNVTLIQRGQIGQIAILISVIKSIADNKFVWYVKRDKIRMHVNFLPTELAEQDTSSQRRRRQVPERLGCSHQCVSCVEYVVD